jgi:uncharacterized cupredoxin-like copper-binding protein
MTTGDAHETEAIALDTHDDDHDAHDVEPMVIDMPDDGEIVEISLNVVEGAAPWGFSPNLIEVPLGHRVMLTLNNGGRAEHDIEIANFDAEYVESMAVMVHHDADGGHDETVVAVHAMPGTSASVMFTPTARREGRGPI